jgi:hypothetical protein
MKIRDDSSELVQVHWGEDGKIPHLNKKDLFTITDDYSQQLSSISLMKKVIDKIRNTLKSYNLFKFILSLVVLDFVCIFGAIVVDYIDLSILNESNVKLIDELKEKCFENSIFPVNLDNNSIIMKTNLTHHLYQLDSNSFNNSSLHSAFLVIGYILKYSITIINGKYYNQLSISNFIEI